MGRPLYHEHPDLLALEAEVRDARPGAVLVERSPFFPGGGGQLADRGTLAWQGGTHAVTAITPTEAGTWLAFAGDAVPAGTVLLTVEPAFRASMCELHTLAHIVNNLVYTGFDGALLTGAQLGADGTFRLDCDLPGADNDRLRALAGPINEVLRQDLAVTTSHMDYAAAQAVPGLFRSKAVAPPPQADGSVRIVEIQGLDRQACGGTHLASTGRARPVRVLKIESKGRQNRRIRVGVAGVD